MTMMMVVCRVVFFGGRGFEDALLLHGFASRATFHAIPLSVSRSVSVERGRVAVDIERVTSWLVLQVSRAFFGPAARGDPRRGEMQRY